MATPREPSSPSLFVILSATVAATLTAASAAPAKAADPAVQRTAWTDLLPGGTPRTGADAESPPVTGDGPSLKRWLSERLSALARPAELAPIIESFMQRGLEAV